MTHYSLCHAVLLGLWLVHYIVYKIVHYVGNRVSFQTQTHVNPYSQVAQRALSGLGEGHVFCVYRRIFFGELLLIFVFESRINRANGFLALTFPTEMNPYFCCNLHTLQAVYFLINQMSKINALLLHAL
jgi:hypothetical protein